MDLRNNVGFGCVGLTAQPFERTALALLDTAFNEGIFHFDTAPLYGNGYSEKILGKFLKGKRDKVSISTKFGLSPNNTINIPIWAALPLNKMKKIAKKRDELNTTFHLPGLTPYRKIDLYEIKSSFEISCKNLKTEYIDYYLLHEALPSFVTDEALNYLFCLKRNKQIGKIGIATSYVNFNNLLPNELNNWEILQYENGGMYLSDQVVQQFPGKLHFYHSVFKSFQYPGNPVPGLEMLRGLILTKAIKNNPAGKVLFSSSRRDHIKMNLAGIDKYENMNLNDVNMLLTHALH